MIAVASTLAAPVAKRMLQEGGVELCCLNRHVYTYNNIDFILDHFVQAQNFCITQDAPAAYAGQMSSAATPTGGPFAHCDCLNAPGGACVCQFQQLPQITCRAPNIGTFLSTVPVGYLVSSLQCHMVC